MPAEVRLIRWLDAEFLAWCQSQGDDAGNEDTSSADPTAIVDFFQQIAKG